MMHSRHQEPHRQQSLINGLHSRIPDIFLTKPRNKHDGSARKVRKNVEMLEAKLIIHRGKHLLATDKLLGFIPTNTSDPFCKVRFMPNGRVKNIDSTSSASEVLYLGKTRVVKDTVNPKWGNDQVFSVSMPVSELQEDDAVFQVRIWSKDKHSKDDPMGAVHIPIYTNNTSSKNTKPIDRAFPGDIIDSTEKKDWYQVEGIHEDKEGKGKIQCTLKITRSIQEQLVDVVADNNDDNVDNNGRNLITGNNNSTCCEGEILDQHYFGIKIRIIQAEGLPKTGTNFLGQSTEGDPYVIVRLIDDPDKLSQQQQSTQQGDSGYRRDGFKGIVLGKTEWLEDKTDPYWNEVFTTRIPIDELDHHAYFLLKVKDRNNVGKDVLMGRVQIGMEELRHTICPTTNPVVKSTHWYTLQPPNGDSDNGGEGAGRIRVKITLSLLLAGTKDSSP